MVDKQGNKKQQMKSVLGMNGMNKDNWSAWGKGALQGSFIKIQKKRIYWHKY